MEKSSALRHLVKSGIAIFICCFFSNLVLARSLDSTVSARKLIRSIRIDHPTKVSIDVYGNIYTADFQGNIFKFDSSGRMLLRYSPSRKAEISSLEARRNLNVFLFSKNLQEYYFLDRFLASASKGKFSQEIGFARAATIASDNNIWLIDEVDFSLKKYDTHKQNYVLKTPLDLLLDPKAYQINYLIEYQNLLFVNDEASGLMVFDNLGNLRNKTGLKSLKYFNFLKDDLYYLKNDSLIFYNIYRSEIVKVISLVDSHYTFALCAKNRLYLFKEDQLDIYSLE
ncbi:MAG TPA: hypothetical protein VF691_04605 [Cytophagaceae bacterium]|jgi:hypothetical protein